MTDLSQLIERVEAATEGSRELDVAIILALHPEAGPYSPHCQGDEPIFWNAPYYKQECPHLTASLDAALTLLPERHDWSLFFDNGAALAGCQPVSEDGCDITDTPGATPALALLAAILRARQTENSHDES